MKNDLYMKVIMTVCQIENCAGGWPAYRPLWRQMAFKKSLFVARSCATPILA